MEWFNATTTGTYINIRETASTSGTVLGKTGGQKGESCQVGYDGSGDGEFLKVKYGNISGYIAARYVAVEARYPATVNISSGVLNIRQKPTTSSTILYTVQKNATVNYVASSNGWHMVSTSSGTGWALDDYIIVD